jgi:RNA polymerase sigma-70 factor (ECF subfamily)
VNVPALVADLARTEAPRVLATLIRFLGDIDAAEEAVQDAMITALERWPVDGVPDRPGAWLTTTARNKALDRLRREARRDAKHLEAVRLLDDLGPPASRDASGIEDDQLRLIFTCSHPALPPEARVALTLRTVAGLTTPEIARAFLVPEATVAQRIVRAKKKIALAAIPYVVPAAHDLPSRTTSVLDVVETVFTEGSHATSGDDVVRVDLADEAVRLGRLLAELMPDEPEVLARDPGPASRARRGRGRHPRAPGPRALGPRRDRRGARPGPARAAAGATGAAAAARGVGLRARARAHLGRDGLAGGPRPL